MRFGILGTGRITRRLVADLQTTEGVKVTAIASRSASRAQWCSGEYGITHALEGYESLIQSDLVDAVYIALPPSLHMTWAVAAAVAGKHLLCEKPLATTLSEGRQIAAAAAKSNVRWLDATAWLHHPRTAAMLDMVQQGQLGSLRHISAAVSFFEPFQDNDHRRAAELGGGCLLDLAWYTAGCAIRAAGAAKSVYAQAIFREAVPFRVNAIAWFDHDVTANLNCGYDTATRKWMEWAGDQAAVVCDDFTRPWADRAPRCWVHDRSGAVVSHQFTGNQERAMIQTLIGNDDLAPFHLQAIRTQATLDAMIRSVHSGKVEPVQCE